MKVPLTAAVEDMQLDASSMAPIKIVLSGHGTDDFTFMQRSPAEGAKTTKEVDMERIKSLVSQQAALALEVENARLAYEVARLRLQTHDVTSGSLISMSFPVQDTFPLMDAYR